IVDRYAITIYPYSFQPWIRSWIATRSQSILIRYAALAYQGYFVCNNGQTKINLTRFDAILYGFLGKIACYAALALSA
ncbi:MAG: hypothetical protein KJ630_11195, partial [Proteobacteria bacterium]|nr:hypothetical protein [Pseudomonadota bacterium]